MARVRNVYGEALSLPELGRTVAAGETFEVPDERLEGFSNEDYWSVVEGTAAHERAVRAAATRKANAEAGSDTEDSTDNVEEK